MDDFTLAECYGEWIAFSVPGSKATYQPIFNLATGEAECDCADFQFRGHERPCKHLRRIIIATKEIVTAHLPVLSELATEDARYRALVAHKETLARTVMPANATTAQVNAFILLCSRYGLDPFTGEAWAFPKPGGGIGFMPGYRAYLRRAQDHPDFEFIRFGVVMKGEPCTVNIATGEVSHEAMIDDSDAKPIGAWWQAKRKGGPQMAGRVLLKNVMGKSGAWQTHPVQMLRKCALQEACLTVFGLTPPMVVGGGDDDEIDFDHETGEIQVHYENVIDAEIVTDGGSRPSDNAPDTQSRKESEPVNTESSPVSDPIGAEPDDNSPNKLVPEGEAPTNTSDDGFDNSQITPSTCKDDFSGEPSVAGANPNPEAPVIAKARQRVVELAKEMNWPPLGHSAWRQVFEKVGGVENLRVPNLTEWNRIIDWIGKVQDQKANEPMLFAEFRKAKQMSAIPEDSKSEGEYDAFKDPDNAERVVEYTVANERMAIATAFMQRLKLTKAQELRIGKIPGWVDVVLECKNTQEITDSREFVSWCENQAKQEVS